MKFIKTLKTVSLADVPSVGAKAASLGHMINFLAHADVKVPHGFAITVDGYWSFIHRNNLMSEIVRLISCITNYDDLFLVKEIGLQIRNLFLDGTIPESLSQEITAAYRQLGQEYKHKNLSVAVRSSATAEDLCDASFAGQQESYLHIRGNAQLLDSVKQCFASLFTDRALVYRHQKGFDSTKIAMAIVIQKMVHADNAVSGVAFSLDTESGFKNVVTINACYGLGQSIVQGLINPDEYTVFKPTVPTHSHPILKKKLGTKKIKQIYKKHDIVKRNTRKVEQQQFCLSDSEIISLAQMVCTIEDFYSQEKGNWCPMDIEWAKDSTDNQLYIVQARPETVHSRNDTLIYKQFSISNIPPISLVTGQSVGQHIISGVACVIESLADIHTIQPGDILITHMTDPDWIPVLKKAAGIITQTGGRTCHAAIIARELQIPAIVGAVDAVKKIKNGMAITIDCSQGLTGYVYEGKIPFELRETRLANIGAAPVSITINLADPDRAFALSSLPVEGVGLARIEFIINNTITVHPLALLYPELVTNKKIIRAINQITHGYNDKKLFFIDNLAQGIATIAAAFYPRPVIVRLSDFKTNEYRNLLGGSYFEPHEENPMLGFRGASRYYAPVYKEAFALECLALKKVREQMGLTNIKVMVPFVRTIQEGKRVIQEMAQHGLCQTDGLEIIMMCEIPSNVLLVDEFLKDFDGISIGSNDLTQLTLGIDRDSQSVQGLFDERDPALKKMFTLAIQGANRAGKYSGICGQAPSDYPEVADYLIKLGIQSISLNPDSVIPFLMRYENQMPILNNTNSLLKDIISPFVPMEAQRAE